MSQYFNQQPWWTLPTSQFPPAFRDDRREVEVERLSSLLTYSERDLDHNLRTRVRRATTLLESAALDNYNGVTSDRWEVIALLQETLGVIDRDKQEYQWLLSALSWQLANAPSIAEHLSSWLNRQGSFNQRDIIEQLAIAFSKRDFNSLRGLAELSIDDGERLKKLAIESEDLACAAEAVMLLSMGSVLREVSQYVRFGTDSMPNLDPLQDFINIANSIGDARRFRIGRLFSKCIYKFVSASSRLIVEDIYGLSEVSKGRILAHLKQYPELWPTQQDAIQKGLLDTSRKHFIVAVPTSSGKTLCGELAILQELSDNPNAVCFYVAPTRALVEEKSQEIKRRLRQFNIQVATATGALQQDELEASLFEDASVIVCTPEKLDLLIRHEDTAVSRASLFIIDEAQMISDDGRGLGLEFVVVKLLIHKPDARILMLSAMLPNSEDFGDWLLYATVASSTWRPTRQRFGEINFIKRQRTGVSMQVQLYDSSDELEGLQIPIDSFSRQPSSGMEKVVWAVEAFRKKGPVLVFCMTKPRCEELVLKIVESEKRRREHYPISSEFAPSAEVEVLRKKIKREVANNFLLNEALSFGIAYHHADLPPRIRIDLEHLIARNQVNVVVLGHPSVQFDEQPKAQCSDPLLNSS